MALIQEIFFTVFALLVDYELLVHELILLLQNEDILERLDDMVYLQKMYPSLDDNIFLLVPAD